MADTTQEVEVIPAPVAVCAYEDSASPVPRAYLRALKLLQQAHRRLLVEAEQRVAQHARELAPVLDGAAQELVRAASDIRDMLQTDATARQLALFERFGVALGNVAIQDASAAAEERGDVRRTGSVGETIVHPED